MEIKTLIIEDEEPARLVVKKYLEQHPEILLIGELADGFSGGKAINELKPDLVFLDIQMPRLSGFEVLELVDHKPLVVFCTAFDQFALKAFEANAIDYLLKPFSKERFSQAVNKIINKFKEQIDDSKNIANVLNAYENKDERISRIAVRTGNKIHVVQMEQVRYLEADGDYVKIHSGDNSFLKEKPLKYFENHLDPKQFVRIHRSYIINVNEISRLEYYDKEYYMAILKNDEHLKVSANGYKLLKEHLLL